MANENDTFAPPSEEELEMFAPPTESEVEEVLSDETPIKVVSEASLDLGGQEATAGIVGAGMYAGQKGVESLEDKIGVFRKLKESVDPNILAYKGVGGDSSAKQKAMTVDQKKAIGKTLLKEDVPGIFTNPQDRYENIQEKLKEAGQEIGKESKAAKEIIKKSTPQVQKKFSKVFGEQIANEFEALANDLSGNVDSEKKLKTRILKEARNYRKGVDLVDIEKDIKAYAKDAGYLEYGGTPTHPLAGKQRNILQKVRVDTITTLIEDGNGDVSRLKDLNKRYFDLSNAEKVVSKFRDRTAVRTAVDAGGDAGKKILKASIGGFFAGIPGAIGALASDSQVQRTASRMAAKAQMGKVGDILKKVGGGLKIGGKLLWKSLPLVGALTAYQTARAEGLSVKEATASAGLDEFTDSIPIVGQVKMLLEPTKAGPKYGSFAERLESGKDISPEEVKEMRNASYSIPDSSDDNVKSLIENMRQHPEADKYERFLTPLVKSLDKPKQTRDAILFGLMQHPTFRKLIKGKKKEE